MRKNTFVAAVIVAALFSTGCKKFLEEVPKDEIIPTTTKDFSELLMGEGYPMLSASSVDIPPINCLTTLMDDDIDGIAPRTSTSARTLSYKESFTWQPNFFLKYQEAANTTGANPWTGFYNRIKGCNIALKYADGSTGSQADKDYLKGEAYTLRAYYYFQLVNLYGLPYGDPASTPTTDAGVPLVLSPDIKDEALPRNTVQEVYTQVLSDIEAAIVLLEKEKRNAGYFRINHLAAHLIASRIYLYMNNWAKTIEHANTVIAEKSLLADLNTYVFNAEKTNVVATVSFPETIWITGIGTEAQPGDLATNTTMFTLSEGLAATYDAADLRLGTYVVKQASSSRNPWKADKWTSRSTPGKTWRVSEAYLNRAEAYLRQYMTGNTAAGTAALADLNNLRRNRIKTASYTDWALTDAASLFALYQAERRRELCLEDQRWFDLRRYGMPSIKHIWYESATSRLEYTLTEKDPAYVLPIPDDVLLRNTRLKQNTLAASRTGQPL